MVRYLKHRDVYLVEIIKDVGYIKKKKQQHVGEIKDGINKEEI